ncbi:ribosome assembly factor SBDS [Candidatus Woesearchaeota archaeon]|nr:ribosome assembly factor SBDS [Candidatus Woesearchaeota archaeon]
MKGPTYDQERVSLNVARLKAHGQNFEVVIEPEKAIKFRHGEGEVREALKAERIFREALKGEPAPEKELIDVFKTADALQIAEKIIKEGIIQVNDEYRDNLRQEAKKKFIEILLKNGVDANTGTPLTATKISNAMTQAKVHLDIFKKVEPQVDEIVAKLKPVLPISFEKKVLSIRIPAVNAAKLYGTVSRMAKIVDEAWLSDGSWSAKVEMVPGAVAGLMDELKSKTHGDVEINIEQTKRR